MRRFQRIDENKEESFFQNYIHFDLNAIFLLDDQEKILSMNWDAEQLFDYLPSEVAGKSIDFLLSKDRCLALSRNGTETPVKVVQNEVVYQSIKQYIVLVHDLKRKNLTDQLSKLIYDSFHEIYVLDASTFFIKVNQEGCHNLGFSWNELAAMSLPDIMPEICKDEFTRYINDLVSGERTKITFETVNRRKDHTTYPVEATLQIIVNGNQPLFVCIVRDTIERKQAEEMINYLSYKDHTTNLPNRSLFNDRLNLSIAQAKRHIHSFAVIFLDLDRFKNINDSLGHSLGDLLLKAVADRLSRCLRDHDTVSRFGGDEFVLLLTNVARVEDVAKIAQRITKALTKSFQINEYELFVSASLGISIYPSDGVEGETLLKNAGVAMNRVKEQGGNYYQFYSPEMNKKVFERLVLENSLRKALDRQEFLLFYQPQYNSKSKKIVGVEALIRWQHPEFGLISPGQFIPLAEETGLIVQIGEWVMRTACQQNKNWQKQGFPPLDVGVNMSALQFKHQNLVKMVAQVLEETQLDGCCLRLELTETNFMENAEEIITVLHELKRMNIQLSIDDFGTGYSSLSYLKRFPVDILKIDQSFLSGITTNESDREIIAAMISLGHALKLNVIAEGVETKEQFDFIQALHCDEVQGFLFSQPLAPEEFEKLLAKNYDIKQI
jgi:diguanylate cyclase (GGDEF)-like protein/PAS domain S-box-containing protein